MPSIAEGAVYFSKCVQSGSKGTQRTHGDCQRVWNSALVPTPTSSKRCRDTENPGIMKTQSASLWRSRLESKRWIYRWRNVNAKTLLGTTFWSARRVLVNLYEFVWSSLLRVARGTRVSRWRTSSRHITNGLMTCGFILGVDASTSNFQIFNSGNLIRCVCMKISVSANWVGRLL